MSETSELFDRDEPAPRAPGSRRAEKEKRRGPVGLLVLLLVAALAVGGLYWGGKKGVDYVSGLVSGPEDYAGPGEGEVLFEVKQGDTAAVMGRGLKEAGVVASVQAFIDAASVNPSSSGIQVGFYELQSKMAAADALAVLVDPANRSKNAVTVPEGLRVTDILDVLAKKTEFSRKQYEKALKSPDLDLPDYADGNAEGYLFPATYEVTPTDKPIDILGKMVDRWRQAADEFELEDRAADLGRTPAEIMIIASLVEAEGRGDDMFKISRVIYNRLDGPGNKGGTNGTLGIDASNAYGIGKSGTTQLSPAELARDTPYDTRRRAGLPPTPIESPGDLAIEAALNPAEGPWYYYVTVNLETGETKFTENYDEFLVFKNEMLAYCDTVERC